jgi:glycine cleavage system H protein
MSNSPSDLRYAKSHEWVRTESDGSVTIGITEHAQDQLGDMVFVETPEAGRTLGAGEACAVVESVKAASDVYSPIAGEVIAGNDALGGSPELVNSDPFGAGWILRLKPANPADIAALMDAATYDAMVAAEEH